MNLSNGTLLQGGKYRIIRFISNGGFGCTYEAEHVMLKKRVAIKEFFVKDFCNRDETTSNVVVGIQSRQALVDKLRHKFIEEAQALCQLEYPGIVRVTDVFEDYSTAYFVMDYVDGCSLNDMVKQNGPLPEAVALRYMRQIANAMKYVHSLNRLHLDIKPGNILVDRTDQAVLIDFGASKQYDEQDGENNSTLLGKTPGYAPLEQMGNDVSTFLPATDIYAIGATLYKLITGDTPPTSNLLATGEYTIDIDPSLASPNTIRAIREAMQVSKRRRPQTIDAFLDILDGKAPSDEEATQFDPDAAKRNGGAQPQPNMQQPPRMPQQPPQMPQQPQPRQQGPQRPQGPQPPQPPKPKQGPAPTPLQQPVQQPVSQPVYDDEPNKSSKKWIIIGAVFAVLLLLVFIFAAIGDEPEPQVVEEDSSTVVVDSIERISTTELTFKNSKGVTFTYTGECVKDAEGRFIPDGEGKGVYKEGVYEGKYINGLRHGEGSYTTNDKSNRFNGTYADDMYNEGTLTFDDGSFYKGTFKNNNYNNGKWYNKDGSFDSEVVAGKIK